jgi:ectoine hydroxylase-related dioxygenase (phytanoyl-CoA dioxygenase family)
MCTRPVLFFNHPQLAKEEVYYKTPKHQDWPSMEASLNSLVVWVPLVDVNEENGSIIIYPGSHKQGVLPFNVNGGFAEVEYKGESIQPTMEIGDIAIFSTFLVHKSGDILDNSIRWSCHFRYTDMLENDFIKRGYPNPYIYKPITKQ